MSGDVTIATSTAVCCPFMQGIIRLQMQMLIVKSVMLCRREKHLGGYEEKGISGAETEKSGVSAAVQAFRKEQGISEETEQSPRASDQEIHQTLSLLLGMLSLKPNHRAHLCSEKRGLTDEQIQECGFKSTPPFFLCRRLTERLIRQGCTVAGVPGFYMDEHGQWTVKFGSRTSGILIPAVGIDGLIRGAQILLDVPLKIQVIHRRKQELNISGCHPLQSIWG